MAVDQVGLAERGLDIACCGFECDEPGVMCTSCKHAVCQPCIENDAGCPVCGEDACWECRQRAYRVYGRFMRTWAQEAMQGVHGEASYDYAHMWLLERGEMSDVV